MNFKPIESVALAMLVTIVFSSLGGLRAVLFTDLFLFILAMFGAIVAAVVVCRLPEVHGLTGLFSHPNVTNKLSLLPDFKDSANLISLLIIPLAVQWWSVWYPGSEPGGGGYLAQRMLSAKNEKNAMGATLFFNAAHYALRPWPWIIVALSSLIVFPNLHALQSAFPHVNQAIIKNDLAYPAMLTFLPNGLLGIVVVSLVAAYMSTMSTHLNWGASYIVNDFYKRFIKPAASEKELVYVGRLSTVSLMVLAGIFALLLSNALQAFHILLQIGAGTGLIFILRWFWWRINAFSELTGMIVSFLIAVYLEIFHVKFGFDPINDHIKLVIGVGITTLCWILVTLLTKPSNEKTLQKFYKLVRPAGQGWNAVLSAAEKSGNPITKKPAEGDLSLGILCMVIGCFAVYSFLFGVGFYLYSQWIPAAVCTVISVCSGLFLIKSWNRLELK